MATREYRAMIERERTEIGPLGRTAPAARAPDAEARATILVVEDDASIAELLVELLESVGYRAFHTNNGRNALTIARAIHPELVLTDYLMPEVNGKQIIHTLRASPATHDIPAVLMSSTRPREAALRDVPFLPKPFNLEDVLTIVERHIAEPLPPIE